jgi:microcystin-dependent protein
MASTYSTTLGIEKMGAGDQSGTWGTTTNYNWDIIDRIIGYSTITLGATSYTLDVRVASPSSGASNVQTGMYRVLNFGDGGDLGGNATVTISTSTTSVYFIAKNGLSASRSIIFTQGTGVATFTLPAGKSALIYADGSDEVHNAFKDFYIETLQTTGAATVGGALSVTGATTLTTDLTVPNGGTGVSTFTDKGVLYGQGASAVLVTAAGSEGQLLRAGSGGTPAFTTINAVNPPGAIVMYAATSAPTGYLLCEGSNVSRTTYSDLFAAIGTNYGVGDGSSTFGLPNLEGRFPIGYDGSTYALNGTGGALTDTPTLSGTNAGTALTIANLPAHGHDTWGSVWPSGSWTGGTGTSQSSVTQTSGTLVTASTLRTLDTGSGTTHTHAWTGTSTAVDTVPPYIVVNYIIKT